MEDSHSRNVFCAVCGGHAFVEPRPLRLGGWVDPEDGPEGGGGGGDLVRRWTTVDIGACAVCGHVQVTTPLTAEDVAALYVARPVDRSALDSERFVRSASPDWGRDLFAFCQPEMIAPGTLIADVGCGDGAALATLHAWYGIPADRLIGIDFADAPIPPPFRFARADLNALAAREEAIPGIGEPIGFAFCLSVLEHALDPRAFLRLIRRHLAPGGHLCIDVPDAAVIGAPDRLGDTVLIHPHHLHYFSAEALAAIAGTSGFAVARLRRVDGPRYPRIMALLRRVEPALTHAAVSAGIALTDRRSAVAAATAARLSERPGGVRLWGVGADFERLLELSGTLRGALGDRGRVRLYDGAWRGRRVHGAPVEDPARLGDPDDRSPIVMTPLPAHARAGMRSAAAQGGFADRLVDPYVPDAAG